MVIVCMVYTIAWYKIAGTVEYIKVGTVRTKHGFWNEILVSLPLTTEAMILVEPYYKARYRSYGEPKRSWFW